MVTHVEGLTIRAAFCVHIYSFMFRIHVFPQILKQSQFPPYLSYRCASLGDLHFDSLRGLSLQAITALSGLSQGKVVRQRSSFVF